MGKRVRFSYKLGVVLFICTILYNEHLIYSINSLTWNKLECEDQSKCLKILLVADPQLIGEKNEIHHFLTPLSIWDSDRFLRKTYALVVEHLAPDVIVFLGDLFDEGSIATSTQYYRYLKRLFSIFTTENPITVSKLNDVMDYKFLIVHQRTQKYSRRGQYIVHIWLPGDNDIGGETDRVTQSKIERFEKSFSQSSVIDVKNIRFSKINRMIHDRPKSFDLMEQNDNNEQKISIVVSHMPLILVPGTIVDKVIEILKPKLILAAHEHKAKVIRSNTGQNYRKIDELNPQKNQIYKYKLEKDKIIEVLAPTCSYRMGTPNIGYGAVIIDNDETIQYTVFWSPKRFEYLTSYLIVLAILLTFILIECIYRSICRPRINFISKYSYRVVKNGV